MNLPPIVINIFGAPGAGKSTAAAALFALMKLEGYKVELVTEHAKDLTYSESFKELSDQLKVFGEQNHRMNRLVGHVDYIVTDSPLMNSLVYGNEDSLHFKGLVMEKHCEYDNVNVYINRIKDYAAYGRTQTAEESDMLGEKILSILATYNQEYIPIDGGADAAAHILQAFKNSQQTNVPILKTPLTSSAKIKFKRHP